MFWVHLSNFHLDVSQNAIEGVVDSISLPERMESLRTLGTKITHVIRGRKFTLNGDEEETRGKFGE